MFTREFFALGKQRLRPGGVWAQWLHAYGMNEAELKSLLATFADVYPHVVVYDALNVSDLVLMGSDRPLHPNPDRLLNQPEVAARLASVDIEEPLDLAERFLMDRSAILKMAGPVPLNTDDNLRVEYAAPRSVHQNTSANNAKLILDYATLPHDFEFDPPSLFERYTDRLDPRRKRVLEDAAP